MAQGLIKKSSVGANAGKSQKQPKSSVGGGNKSAKRSLGPKRGGNLLSSMGTLIRVYTVSCIDIL